ncbi:hypothetical protein FKP32DRAFT_1592285 [Trametes sanguinea]|nr:hypothetical protein FKP32DRAFT_1592285 [Trametes sanguinea]
MTAARARAPRPSFFHRPANSHSSRPLSSTAPPHNHSSSSTNQPTPYPLLKTRPVPLVPPSLASSPQAFLSSLRTREPPATPFLLRAPLPAHPDPTRPSRSERLLATLRAAGERLVEVEVGRYDRPAGFERVQVPLGVYVEWLTRSCGGSEGGGRAEESVQLYLAQWRARDEVEFRLCVERGFGKGLMDAA